jgi:hypothetical protein
MNYKQLILSVIALLIAIYIPLVTAYAQEVTAAPSPSLAPPANTGLVPAPTPIEYQLPYPGMLPDNPLYFLKVFRDNMTALFLSKPSDKATFFLMQSDKNVEASYILEAQLHPKTDLAFQTFVHAQNDFDQAITQGISAKKQGYSTKELADKMALANQKHEQILQAIAEMSGQTSSQTVQDERARVKTFAKEIKSINQ